MNLIAVISIQIYHQQLYPLEVENQHAPGQFIKVIPLKNAIMMNIGDLLMRWSNSESIPLAAFLLMLNCWQII
jgi:hypothetical protein